MMDSKQLALVYLMEEANRMATVCTKNVHSLAKKNTKQELSDQMGRLFAACKEVVEEYQLNEETVMGAAESEANRRISDR